MKFIAHFEAWFVATLLALPLGGRSAGRTEDIRARTLLDSAPFKAAVAVYERDFDRFVSELVTLTEIPSPPFKEQARGIGYARMLRQAGLEDVEIDEVGNVIGTWRGRGGDRLLAVAAHLDTVFPEGTDVTVKRSGTRLIAPGVGDDTRGLAFLLAAIRAMKVGGITTAGDILFVADVGEEGPGNLRGMRHLFQEGAWKDRIRRFITVDGRSNDLIANGALGSRRYRVTFKGPGGHSWAAFGQVSPAFALGHAIAALGRLEVPKKPKVSYNVGIVAGGTSVNSIPFEVSMDVDLRSVSPVELGIVDERFRRIVSQAVEAENAARATTFGRIEAELKIIGDRPSGMTSPDTPELRQVAATMRAFGKVAVWETGSTDANIPISLGIPAVAIAPQAATHGGRAHALDEWTDVEKTQAIRDFSLALALIVTVADLP